MDVFELEDNSIQHDAAQTDSECEGGADVENDGEVDAEVDFHGENVPVDGNEWSYLSELPAISFVNVEDFLYEIASTEFKILHRRTVDKFRQVFPNQDFGSCSPAQIAVLLIQPILVIFYEVVNADADGQHLS